MMNWISRFDDVLLMIDNYMPVTVFIINVNKCCFCKIFLYLFSTIFCGIMSKKFFHNLVLCDENDALWPIKTSVLNLRGAA